eukprot:scaffold83100_cov60-Attheya_sp.AAC.1
MKERRTIDARMLKKLLLPTVAVFFCMHCSSQSSSFAFAFEFAFAFSSHHGSSSSATFVKNPRPRVSGSFLFSTLNRQMGDTNNNDNDDVNHDDDSKSTWDVALQSSCALDRALDQTAEALRTRSGTNDSKQWHMALVERGMAFDSMWRRFDFMDDNHNMLLLQDDDDDDDDDDSSPAGEWRRDARFSNHDSNHDDNNNNNNSVVRYLMGHGLDTETAKMEAQRPYVQQFTRTLQKNEQQQQQGPVFQVNTDHGRRITTYSLDHEGWTEDNIPNSAVLFGKHPPTSNTSSSSSSSSLSSLQRKTKWTRDHRHVTVTMTPNGGTETTTRYLAFCSKDNDSMVWNNHNHMVVPLPEDDLVMVVERSYTPPSHNNENDIENENIQEPTVLHCKEVFARFHYSSTSVSASPSESKTTSSNDRDRMVLRGVKTSPLVRVPGCVANVQIRITLLPITTSTTGEDQESMESEEESESKLLSLVPENSDNDVNQYKVRLDGEADALVSRGLLALLSHVVSRPDVRAHDILELDATSVARRLGLDTLLSPGRNDGLASMIQVMQHQIKQLVSFSPLLQDTNHHINNNNNNKTTQDDIATAQKDLNPFVEGNERPNKEEEEEENKGQQPTVAMLLSGGVDSSVALNLLKRQGYNVTAFYLKIWLEDELAHLGECPWEDDYANCVAVCDQANIPLETVSLQQHYKETVISYTVQEAQRGRTPNPDIMCNSRVKFGCFYDAIEGRGFDFVASGHYAQLMDDDNNDDEEEQEGGIKKKRLFRAPDPVKDQSYFLCALTQEQLSRVLFPIGPFHKSEVRALAQEFDLPNKDRPDSQGLCFLGKIKFDEFLRAYLGEQPGDILDASTGEKIGRHKALWYHTVGQRKGIGKVLHPQETAKGPWYVVAKDPDRNILLASNKYDEDTFSAARSEFYVEDIRWIAKQVPDEIQQGGNKGRINMKIRHGPTIVEGLLELLSTKEDETSGKIRLDAKDGGLAPGQFVAFYGLHTEECYGGGIISERHWTKLLLENELVLTRTDN